MTNKDKEAIISTARKALELPSETKDERRTTHIVVPVLMDGGFGQISYAVTFIKQYIGDVCIGWEFEKMDD